MGLRPPLAMGGGAQAGLVCCELMMHCLDPQEVCTLFLAAHLMGDQLTPLNWLGFAVCLLGISLHVALKALRGKEGGRGGAERPSFYGPLQGSSPLPSHAGPKGTKHPEAPGSPADLELLLLPNSQEEEEEEEAPLR